MTVLAGLGVPDTLQINDVHLANACGPATGAGPFRLFDLGDAFWSHPFAVLHLRLRAASGGGRGLGRPSSPWRGNEHARLGIPGQWPEIGRDQRAEVLVAADRLGAAHRAVSWDRLLREVDPDRLGMPLPTIADWVRQALV